MEYQGIRRGMVMSDEEALLAAIEASKKDTRMTEEEVLQAAMEASKEEPQFQGQHDGSMMQRWQQDGCMMRRPQQDGSATFPNQLGPFTLEATHFSKEDLKFSKKTKVPEDWTMSPHRLKEPAREVVLSQIAVAFVRGRFSPEHPVTLSEDARRVAGIPQAATFFCWSYPIDQDLLSGDGDISPDIAFLIFGGFVYFDKDHQMLSALALKPSEDGGLRFDAPLPWLAEMTKRIGYHRFKPVTIPLLCDAGARYFSWIRPAEIPDAEHGAFAYLFHGKTRSSQYIDGDVDIYFPVSGSGGDTRGPRSSTRNAAVQGGKSTIDSDLVLANQTSHVNATEVSSPHKASPHAGRRRTPPPKNSTSAVRADETLFGTGFSPSTRASVKSAAKRKSKTSTARASTPPPQASKARPSTAGQAFQRSSSFSNIRPGQGALSSSQDISSSPSMFASSSRLSTLRPKERSCPFPKYPNAPRRGQLSVSITPEQDPAVADEFSVVVSIQPPDGCATTKSHICCVLDISGSMGKEASIQTAGGSTESHGLCLLDIAKHGVRAIMHTLGDQDWISVVSFNNVAHTLLSATRMNEEGKAKAESILDALHPKGGTDIWAGLREGLNLLQSKASELERDGYFSHIMLLTDGASKNKDEIIPNYRRYLPITWSPCSINTFGFGYELDSDLLVKLAKIGNGSYAFIPDAGFVGTVFVNTLSNLLLTIGKHASLHFMPGEGAEIVEVYGHPPIREGQEKTTRRGRGTTLNKDTSLYRTVDIGNIQVGQNRDIVLRMRMGSCLDSYLRVGGSYCVAVGNTSERYGMEVITASRASGLAEGAAEMVSKNFGRSIFVDCLDKMSLAHRERTTSDQSCLSKLQEMLRDTIAQLEASTALHSEYTQALLEDANGQVFEAVSRYDWLQKWGVHYLPSVMFAHQLQQCNNFKDASVQFYGGDLFETVRDQADDAFNSLPAPRPCAPPPSAQRSSIAPAPRPVPVSMEIYNYSGGG